MIPLEPFSLYYATVDNTIQLTELCWLSKADITDDKKIIPIHASEWSVFGIHWDSKFYFADRLTYGCRSSPQIFNHLASPVRSIPVTNVTSFRFISRLTTQAPC